MNDVSEKPAPVHLTQDTIASEMFQAGLDLGLEIGWKQGVSDASIPSSPRYKDALKYLRSLLAQMERDA